MAQDDVSQSIPIIFRLNQSMLNVAHQINAGEIRITDNVRRIELIETTNAVISMPPGSERNAALQRAASKILDLSAREHQMQKDASAALLQATQFGNVLIGLSRNYDQIDIKDLLSGLSDALTLAGRISPESKSITQALTRLQATAKAWEEDPVLKLLLAQQITGHE